MKSHWSFFWFKPGWYLWHKGIDHLLEYVKKAIFCRRNTVRDQRLMIWAMANALEYDKITDELKDSLYDCPMVRLKLGYVPEWTLRYRDYCGMVWETPLTVDNLGYPVMTDFARTLIYQYMNERHKALFWKVTPVGVSASSGRT